MLDFEYGYPYSSCYTESDLRYLASKSKSLFFNQDRFLKNAGWMGIDIHCDNKDQADAMESIYYVKNGSSYWNHTGTKVSSENCDPFFYRWDNVVCFTIPAIFAGRDIHRRVTSLRESCDGYCFVCGAKIENEHEEKWVYNCIHAGVIMDFQGERVEILCGDCFNRWANYNNHLNKYYSDWGYYREGNINQVCRLQTKDQIAFVRFILKMRELKICA